VYGTVRTVVWEDGGGNAPSYPMRILAVGNVVCRRSMRFMQCFLYWPAIASAINFNLEILTMTENNNKEPANRFPKFVQPFLDCVAYLLAKRWLQDQRGRNEQPLRNWTNWTWPIQAPWQFSP
jgi:hypothetical protein